MCYIFFLDWSLDHYVMSIAVQTCWCVDCIVRLQGCDFLWLVSTLGWARVIPVLEQACWRVELGPIIL